MLFSGAAEALDYDIERKGVRCVEFSQTDVGMLVKVADQMGIEWYCVADDDNAGRNYERAVRAQHDGDASSRLIMPYQNVERFLCEHGFGDIYESGSRHIKPGRQRRKVPRSTGNRSLRRCRREVIANPERRWRPC